MAIAVAVAAAPTGAAVGAERFDGIGTVHFDSRLTVFDDVVYRQQIAYQDAVGPQRAYIVEADLFRSDLKPFVFSGEVRGTATVGAMVRYAQEQGYQTVAAINGDIFDTSTGTPKGTVIHNGIIVTSGYGPERVITFDAEGRAAMRHVTLAYGMKGQIGYIYEGAEIEETFEQRVDFVNVPYGAAQGLHLYNRHYADSTRTAGSCVEVVVECGAPENMQLRVNNTITGTVV